MHGCMGEMCHGTRQCDPNAVCGVSATQGWAHLGQLHHKFLHLPSSVQNNLPSTSPTDYTEAIMPRHNSAGLHHVKKHREMHVRQSTQQRSGAGSEGTPEIQPPPLRSWVPGALADTLARVLLPVRGVGGLQLEHRTPTSGRGSEAERGGGRSSLQGGGGGV